MPFPDVYVGRDENGRIGLSRSRSHHLNRRSTQRHAHFRCPEDCSGRTVEEWADLVAREADAIRKMERLKIEKIDLKADLLKRDQEISILRLDIRALQNSSNNSNIFIRQLKDLGDENRKLLEDKKYWEARYGAVNETNDIQYREIERLRHENDRLKIENNKRKDDVSYWKSMYNQISRVFFYPSTSRHHSYNRSYSYA